MSIFYSLNAELTEKDYYSHARWKKQVNVKTQINLSIMEILPLGSGLDFLIYLGKLHPFISFVFLKGLKGLVPKVLVVLYTIKYRQKRHV